MPLVIDNSYKSRKSKLIDWKNKTRRRNCIIYAIHI